MSIDLLFLCPFRIQKLHMANCNSLATFIGALRCIQKIYGLICPLERYHEPSAQRLSVSFFRLENSAEN